MFIEHLYKESIKTTTENGAISFSTSKSAVLDLFSIGGSSRNLTETEIDQMVEKAISENIDLATRVIFYLGDIREGQGERRFFKRALSVLLNRVDEDRATAIIKNIPFFGRWDYLIDVTFDTKYEKIGLNEIEREVAATADTENSSLIFKWLPTAKRYPAKAKKISNAIGLTIPEYRKMLSRERETLRVVERLISDKNWLEIDYSKLPSHAAKRYRNLFLQHDNERYSEYLYDLTNKDNNKKVKVNAGAIMPHEILHSYDAFSYCKNKNVDVLLEEQWKALPNYMSDAKGLILPVVDVSGSMFASVGGSNLMAIEVATALGTYIAERNEGQFKDYFLTFSNKPVMEKLKGNTLLDKINNMAKSDWGYNTNIMATFNLILKTGITNKIRPSEMPSKIIILSDMQFDANKHHLNESIYDAAKREFNHHGYDLPEIIFWNLCGRNKDLPVLMDDIGAATVSGFSPILLKTLLSGKIISPYESMLSIIMKERYDLLF